MKTIFYLPLLTFCLFLTTASAQDFHLTQYDATPHYFNPSLTGVYFGEKRDYRIYSDYRTQWRALGVKPYSTYYLAYDMPFDKFGLGGYLIHNRNGTGGLNTLQVMPSAAYKITNESAGPHHLSVGAQMGILYRHFDPNNFTFDEQFAPDSPTGFDQNISNKETWDKTSILKFDAAMGVFYKYKTPDWQAKPWGGFSVYHVTKPDQSVTGYNKDKMPMRWVAQAGADYQITPEIYAVPMVLYMNQAKAHELNLGVIGFYHIKESMYDVLLGFSYRTQDAFIIQAGMKYGPHIITFSYDINTSRLNDYTNNKGAFELSLILSGNKGQNLFNPKFDRGSTINKSL